MRFPGELHFFGQSDNSSTNSRIALRRVSSRTIRFRSRTIAIGRVRTVARRAKVVAFSADRFSKKSIVDPANLGDVQM